MSEADVAAPNAEWAARNARCAANPREAAQFAATLRRTSHAGKLNWLFNSAIFNYAALVRLMLADGLSPNANKAGQSLLRVAAGYGSIDVVRLLLEAGADTNSCDPTGNTPLLNAISYGEVACARKLIPHTDLRIFAASGHNVQHVSIISNQPEVFKLLLPHFADNVDVRTAKLHPPADPGGAYNCTPLLLACEGGHHAMVKALLASGALRTARNSNSASCLQVAAYGGHLACCDAAHRAPR